jgi:hypothetical protein
VLQSATLQALLWALQSVRPWVQADLLLSVEWAWLWPALVWQWALQSVRPSAPLLAQLWAPASTWLVPWVMVRK